MADKPLVFLRPKEPLPPAAHLWLRADLHNQGGEQVRFVVLPAGVEVIQPQDAAEPSPWWWPFSRRRSVVDVVDFSHIVCKPGDVVCIELPPGLPESVQNRLRRSLGEFSKRYAIKAAVFADGIRIGKPAEGAASAETPAMCPKCGTRRVLLVNRLQDGFTRWVCDCGATGRWRSSMDPMSRTSVRATDRLDAVSAPAGSARPDPLGSLHPEWMRSTTRDRLAACRAVHAPRAVPAVPPMPDFRYPTRAAARYVVEGYMAAAEHAAAKRAPWWWPFARKAA